MRHHNHQSGFTLVELLIGSSLSAILLVGVLSSFTFMGRSLGRMASQQQLETQSRRALQVFDSDARMATALSYRHFGLTPPTRPLSVDLFPDEGVA